MALSGLMDFDITVYCTVIFRYVCDVMDGGQTNTFFPTHAERRAHEISPLPHFFRRHGDMQVCVDNSLRVGPDCGCGSGGFGVRGGPRAISRKITSRPCWTRPTEEAGQGSRGCRCTPERSSPGRRLIFTRAAVHLGPCHHHHHHHQQQIAMPQMGKSFMYVPT
ncbi:uncharacterized protein K489DRAFT_190691 [Dissoconium aciculare CBS 342.82]|uniref:Uncharacterized protein n=1 Tax=Dissoconium aciculare CBS 342.82 TaxID=1314786 RepID=A0A6J3M5C5_9PEZI|nr:uncharacterized protein K489DRAFT_190691 [Dissoconium aciculare CBS 342.82]KAF1823250.1 hypothetical protein K489DRAFT_190691 [Dissoconium aciculare CBS 342.82]